MWTLWWYQAELLYLYFSFVFTVILFLIFLFNSVRFNLLSKMGLLLLSLFWNSLRIICWIFWTSLTSLSLYFYCFGIDHSFKERKKETHKQTKINKRIILNKRSHILWIWIRPICAEIFTLWHFYWLICCCFYKRTSLGSYWRNNKVIKSVLLVD